MPITHFPLHLILEIRLSDEARSYEIIFSPQKQLTQGRDGGDHGLSAPTEFNSGRKAKTSIGSIIIVSGQSKLFR